MFHKCAIEKFFLLKMSLRSVNGVTFLEKKTSERQIWIHELSSGILENFPIINGK